MTSPTFGVSVNFNFEGCLPKICFSSCCGKRKNKNEEEVEKVALEVLKPESKESNEKTKT
jgi:hypothetical protein